MHSGPSSRSAVAALWLAAVGVAAGGCAPTGDDHDDGGIDAGDVDDDTSTGGDTGDVPGDPAQDGTDADAQGDGRGSDDTAATEDTGTADDTDANGDGSVDPDSSSPADTTVADADAATPWFVLGGGYDRFEPIPAANPLVLTEGIQGGFHVYAAIRGNGLASTGCNVELSATDGVGTEVARSALSTNLTFVDGAWEASGLVVFVSADYQYSRLPVAGEESTWSDAWTLCARVYLDDTWTRYLEQCEEVTVGCCTYLPP